MDFTVSYPAHIVDARIIEQPSYDDPDKLQERLRILRVVVNPETGEVRPNSFRAHYFSSATIRRVKGNFSKLGLTLGNGAKVGETIDSIIGTTLLLEERDLPWGDGSIVSRGVPVPIEVFDDFEPTEDFEATITAMWRTWEEEQAIREEAKNGEPTTSEKSVSAVITFSSEQQEALDVITDAIAGGDLEVSDNDDLLAYYKANRTALAPIRRQIQSGDIYGHLIAQGVI